MNVSELVVTVRIAWWVKPFVIVAAIVHFPIGWTESIALRGLRIG